jgi:hypothetical protein
VIEMSNLRDLKVGDVVYVVERHVVTEVTDSVAVLGNNIVTEATAVDDAEQSTLADIYRSQY